MASDRGMTAVGTHVPSFAAVSHTGPMGGAVGPSLSAGDIAAAPVRGTQRLSCQAVNFDCARHQNAAVGGGAPVYLTDTCVLVPMGAERARETVRDCLRKVGVDMRPQPRPSELCSLADDFDEDVMDVFVAVSGNGAAKVNVTYYAHGARGDTVIQLRRVSGNAFSFYKTYGELLAQLSKRVDVRCRRSMPNVPETGGVLPKPALSRGRFPGPQAAAGRDLAMRAADAMAHSGSGAPSEAVSGELSGDAAFPPTAKYVDACMACAQDGNMDVYHNMYRAAMGGKHEAWAREDVLRAAFDVALNRMATPVSLDARVSAMGLLECLASSSTARALLEEDDVVDVLELALGEAAGQAGAVWSLPMQTASLCVIDALAGCGDAAWTELLDMEGAGDSLRAKARAAEAAGGNGDLVPLMNRILAALEA